MKNFATGFFIIASLLIPVFAPAQAETPLQEPIAIGRPAPRFSLPDTQGRTHSLEEYFGKTVVLEWTNHECPFVRKHYESGNMQTLQREATAQGVIWLSIVSSAPGKQGYLEPAAAQKLAKGLGAASTARLLDPSGDVGRLYGARTTPHMYVIDKAGVLVYRGAIDDIPSTDPGDLKSARNYVRAALADRAAGRPVAQPETQPYGCAVKYENR